MNVDPYNELEFINRPWSTMYHPWNRQNKVNGDISIEEKSNIVH